MNLQKQIIHFIDKNTYYGPAMLMDIKVQNVYEQDSIVKLVLRIFLREENHEIIVDGEEIGDADITYIVNTTLCIPINKFKSTKNNSTDITDLNAYLENTSVSIQEFAVHLYNSTLEDSRKLLDKEEKKMNNTFSIEFLSGVEMSLE